MVIINVTELSKEGFEYYEIDFGEDDVSQILKISYAGKEITLSDFCEYTIYEIIAAKGFKDKEIDKKWKSFLNELKK